MIKTNVFFDFIDFLGWSSAALSKQAKEVEQKHEWMSDMASAMLLHGNDEGEWMGREDVALGGLGGLGQKRDGQESESFFFFRVGMSFLFFL
jgi:hypothetical protein